MKSPHPERRAEGAQSKHARSRYHDLLASLRQTISLDRSQLAFGVAARLLPALVAVLGAGLVVGDRAGGAIAAGGAFVVGFGTFQQFTRSRAAPMLIAELGMGLSTFIGTLAGATTATMAIVAFIYAFLCGLLPAIGMGAFWIAQQCAVFLLIAGAYPGGLDHALVRMALVLAGGAAQIACYAVILVIAEGTVRAPGIAAIVLDTHAALSGLRAQFHLRAPLFRFALRFALALAAALVLERLLAIPNGYWAAMSVVLLMRPDFQDTLARSLGRIGGTLAGAAAATIVSDALAPGPLALAALVSGFAFLSYACLRLNYGVFSFFLTGYVIFLLVLAGLAEPRVAGARILGTLIGGGFALAAHLDFYRTRRPSR